MAEKLNKYGNFASKSLFWFTIMMLDFLRHILLLSKVCHKFHLS